MPFSTAEARPPKGFHEGPYLQLLFGAMQANADGLAQSNTSVGHSVEPVFGCFFGWNINDQVAFELVGRYATTTTFGARQHIIRLNANARASLITNPLTDFQSLRIIPFLHAGPVFEAMVLPGDPAAMDLTVRQWSGGIGGGSGVSFFFKEYIYFSVVGQIDMLRRTTVQQTIGGTATVTYGGKWSTGAGGLAGLGVHF
ncbi:MAG: hypothetical protein HYV03_05630 [Deltaproteobacteria bacterium]|nr:hypothetical protein [Deltaproteobacteria bacterium]